MQLRCELNTSRTSADNGKMLQFPPLLLIDVWLRCHIKDFGDFGTDLSGVRDVFQDACMLFYTRNAVRLIRSAACDNQVVVVKSELPVAIMP